MTIITVTSLADSGLGSLREAIALAQAGDTIQFDSSLANQTITLTSGQLEVNKNLIIDGGSTTGLTISGNNAYRVIDLQGIGTNLNLRNLSITNGFTNEEGAGIRTGLQNVLTVENSQFLNNRAGFGGAIASGNFSITTITGSKFDNNDGTLANSERGGGAITVKSLSSLTVRDSEFTRNKGINGGAINNLLSQLTVENSVFLNNDSTAGAGGDSGSGGAIYTDGASDNNNPDAGTILIRNSQFEGNRGAGQGGALFLFVYGSDQVILEDSTILNNQIGRNATGSSLGGGVRHGNGQLTIRNTTIANNQALGQGGGLWVGENSPVTIANSTFSGNQASDVATGDGLGGGMAFANGANPTSIINTTVVNNFARAYAGGILSGEQELVTLSNTIVAYNSAGNPYGITQQTGRQLIDGGNNLQFPGPLNNEDAKITANVIIADPKLGPLQNNGGTTPTHALLEGSAAINAGNSTAATPTDQRGLQRVGSADIGAFEFGATPPDDPDPAVSLTKNDLDLFTIQGDSGDAQLLFNLTQRNTGSVNEIGVFAVDDEQGTINGITPGQADYLAAALSRSEVVFSTLSGNVFPDLNASRLLNVDVGTRLGFYLVQNSTKDTVLADLSAGRTPTNVFFGTTPANADGLDHLQTSELGNNTFTLAWEEALGGQDVDFDDVKLDLQLTNEQPLLGTGLQGERELIDLRTEQLFVSAEFVVNRAAAYDNFYGFYAVDDITGRLGDLNPGDAGYAQAAVSQRVDLSAGLPGGKLLAPFIIANGSPEQFLTQNTNNQPGQAPMAYFAFLGANPDSVDHVRLLADNTFGFEDLYGGGDLDFNDLVVQVKFT